jgi:RNA polymerase sigma factor (sigma-70 family)
MTPRSLLAPARLAGQPVLRTQSDERLVDLVRSGSEAAFEAIVARYRRALLRYCTRILPEERAEDAVQQTFVRAYDSMLNSTRDLALRPWLYRIAHNTALNALRDRGLRHEALDEDLDGVERPDQALERAQGLRAVLAAVQDLPERQRDAIVLRELEGRTYAEIAAELGVTGGAVRQLLNRARHSVRAAATAITPIGLLERIPELGAAGDAAGGGALAAKAAATVLVTGAVVGGAAVAPKHHEPAADAAPERAAKSAVAADQVTRAPASATGAGSSDSDASRSDDRRSRHGRGKDDGDHGRRHRGRRHGGEDRKGHSGKGKGKDEEAEHAPRPSTSGKGHGGGGEAEDDSSGHGGGSSSGKGSGEAAEAAPEPTETSGSGSSGSGDSGKGGGSDDTMTETETDSD